MRLPFIGEVSITVANALFAIGTILGQSTQNISLPLWLDAQEEAKAGGPYFVLFFASLSYVIVFGTLLGIGILSGLIELR